MAGSKRTGLRVACDIFYESECLGSIDGLQPPERAISVDSSAGSIFDTTSGAYSADARYRQLGTRRSAIWRESRDFGFATKCLVLDLIERQQGPFGSSWTDWRPLAEWAVPELASESDEIR